MHLAETWNNKSSQLKALVFFFFFFFSFSFSFFLFFFAVFWFSFFSARNRNILILKGLKLKKTTTPKTKNVLFTFILNITDLTFLLIVLFHFNCAMYTHFFHVTKSPVGFYYGTLKGCLQICIVIASLYKTATTLCLKKTKQNKKTAQSCHILWQNRTFSKHCLT